MEVPQNTLEKLKCAECSNYLSCGPVYVKHDDGEAICGRCCKPEKEKVTQIKQYEAVAEHFLFPCKYHEFGCQEKLQFSMENSNVHEEICNYKEDTCPIGKAEKCNWRGTWGQLVQHCKNKHPQQVFENYCAIFHDIYKPKVIHYLLVALNVLFVLQTKICSISGNIFYTIHLLEKKGKPEDFEYILDIKRNKEHIIKYGKVLAEDTLENEENIALALNINNLEEILGGIDDTIFHITLKNKHAVLFGENQIKCKHCKNDFFPNNYNFEYFPYLDNSNKRFLSLCDSCEPKIKFCKNKNKGCTYYDIESKCEKHETYFCSFISQCIGDHFSKYCKLSITQGTLFKHFKLDHSMDYLQINEPKSYGRKLERYLLSSIIGTIVVEGTNNSITSDFNIYTALKARKLDMYYCKVKMTTPFFKDIEVSTGNNRTEDWSFTINGTNHCKININIIRKDCI